MACCSLNFIFLPLLNSLFLKVICVAFERVEMRKALLLLLFGDLLFIGILKEGVRCSNMALDK
jgi:hypothetical protein